MITFFTTTKDFTGPVAVAQENAIKSWLRSIDGAEIIIFGESNGLDRFKSEQNIILQPTVKCSQTGTPRIDDMFSTAQALASNDICCFINADIIITKKFSESVLALHNILKLNYLLVGQRYDLQVDDAINFNSTWETSLQDLLSESCTIHPPVGSDFFAFPRGQYKPKDIPKLLVGRGGWDLWMIYNGRVKNMNVVDLSPTVKIIHQEHNYAHRKENFVGYAQDSEARTNIKNLPHDGTYLYTLHACNYYFKKDSLHRNIARGNLKKFITYELHLRREQRPYKLAYRILKFLRLIYR